MRKILFRGKRIDNGEWIEGCLIHKISSVGDKQLTLIIGSAEWDDHTGFYHFCNTHHVFPETLGQFTGMHDIHGNKIFEGDIVTALMDYGPAGMNRSTICIEFNINAGGYEWQYFDLDTIEIIGNKYDNPELLD